nr:MAG TPA: hypothetical protein [Caudoviricetes sp.]
MKAAKTRLFPCPNPDSSSFEISVYFMYYGFST